MGKKKEVDEYTRLNTAMDGAQRVRDAWARYFEEPGVTCLPLAVIDSYRRGGEVIQVLQQVREISRERQQELLMNAAKLYRSAEGELKTAAYDFFRRAPSILAKRIVRKNAEPCGPVYNRTLAPALKAIKDMIEYFNRLEGPEQFSLEGAGVLYSDARQKISAFEVK